MPVQLSSRIASVSGICTILQPHFGQHDLHSPILLPSFGIVRAVRFPIGRYRFGFAPAACADARRLDT